MFHLHVHSAPPSPKAQLTCHACALILHARTRVLAGMAAVSVAGGLPTVLPPGGVRFWIDEVLWSHGRIAVELAEQVSN